MNKRVGGARLLAALLMIVMILAMACAAFAEDDPIRVSSLCEPQTVMTEQDVTITIKVYNSSQTDVQEDIALYDSVGTPVERFAGLKAEQSATYTGAWHVTSDQIAKGRINYYIRYNVQTAEGPKQVTYTVPVTIKTEAASPELSATYSVSPTSARKGQEVTITYTLSNTGNVELRAIEIENPGIDAEKLSIASLSVGEKLTLEDVVTMEGKELVSQPVIRYQGADSKDRLVIDDMAKRTITVAQDDLELTLSSADAENAYPGQHVAFKVELKNTGSESYTDLTITDMDGVVIADGVSLASGASHTAEFEREFRQSGSMSVIAAGTDAEGADVTASSETLEVKVQDASRALVLDVKAQAQNTTIYSEPAVVRCAVQVSNIGQTDATNIAITEAGTTVAKIPSLPAGESRIVVFDVETSVAGKLQFVASGKDADGNDRRFESGVLTLTYIAPTPAPTATPRPTAVPPTPSPVPTATPEPSLGERISDVVDPMVLYAACGVLLALLVALLLVSAIRSAAYKKRMANAIDTIEMSSHVRNHRGRRRRDRRAAKEEKPKNDGAAQEIVKAQELTEADAAEKKEERPAEENRRRRPVQEPAAPAAEETLRVAPVEDRPEFMAQQPVNDSQTRVFGKLNVPEQIAQTEAEVKPEAETKPETEAAPEAPAEAVQQGEGGTIRFTREQVNELRRAEEEMTAEKERLAREHQGQRRSEMKPMKKKLGFPFGKKKAKPAEEEDFLDDLPDDLDDDDFIE